MHIFSHKTVQLFVRSLRGYIKSFSVISPKLTANKTAVSNLQTIALRSANIWFVLAKYMV